MSTLGILTNEDISKKLPMYNLKRSLYVAMFFVLFIPVISLVSMACRWDAMFSGSPLKYVFSLFFVSLVYVITSFSCYSRRTKPTVKFLYRSFYLLSFVSIVCLSHVFFARTGSLIIYFIAVVYISIAPVFAKEEIVISSTSSILAAASYIIPYFSDSVIVCQIVFANILLAVLTAWKYSSTLNNMYVKDKLQKELNESSSDPLTGLYNRRGLYRKINSTWGLCARHNIPTAVIMLDIDFFKKYNDAFGHPAGDRCIKAIASVIKQTARRASDVTSRIGGEEFLIFVQDIGREDLLLLAKRIQRGVENLQMPHATKELSDYVTVSIGIAQMIPDGTKNFTDLYEMADKELYNAKENGRNCVSLGGNIFCKTARRIPEKYNSLKTNIYGTSAIK